MSRRNPCCCISEKHIYEKYHQQQPDFVSTIKVLIQKGYSPVDIKNFILSVDDNGSQLAEHVCCVASYLLRQKISQN